jgi:hypothetical protein
VDAALGKALENMPYNIYFANPHGFANRCFAAADLTDCNHFIRK